MRIGVSLLHMLGKSISNAINTVKKYRLEFVEVVDDGSHSLSDDAVDMLNDVRESYGFEYAVHAPFIDTNIASSSDLIRETVLRLFERSMRYASELECRLWIFHPGMKSPLDYFYPEDSWRHCLESSLRIAKMADGYGLTPLIENQIDHELRLLTTVTDFRHFYDEVGVDVKMVLDIGHAHLHRQINGFLDSFPDKIAHIHASDNEGARDDHLGIGYGTIDWLSFARKLMTISFDGVVVVESVTNVPESIERLKDLLLG